MIRPAIFLLLTLLPASLLAQNGKLLTKAQISTLMGSGVIKLGAGTYCLPIDFGMDFGTRDISIDGIPGKTTITSYDSTKPSTNMIIRPLDTNLPDIYPDGLYAVSSHPPYSYGGGFAHIELPYNTAGTTVLYTQGTILKKASGVWSRHYTGYGFRSQGSFTVRNVIFDNCQFYLFSPFGQATSKIFEISGCRFTNITRVLASSLYGGTQHSPNWYNALNYYSITGTFRFEQFSILNSQFEFIHTAVIWGCPPAQTVLISGNTITRCPTAITIFTLYMQNHNSAAWFTDKSFQFIENNSFHNIQQYNNWTTSLIRTSGTTVIKGNIFTACSPQIILLYGGNTIITGNVIAKSNTPAETQSPVILIKNMATPWHMITSNIITAPHSIFIAAEGASNNSIHENILRVKTVYSKNDDTPGDEQTLSIISNDITAGTITNTNCTTPCGLRSITLAGNNLTAVEYIHTGSATISNYSITNNNFQSGNFIPDTTKIINLTLLNNIKN